MIPQGASRLISFSFSLTAARAHAGAEMGERGRVLLLAATNRHGPAGASIAFYSAHSAQYRLFGFDFCAFSRIIAPIIAPIWPSIVSALARPPRLVPRRRSLASLHGGSGTCPAKPPTPYKGGVLVDTPSRVAAEPGQDVLVAV